VTQIVQETLFRGRSYDDDFPPTALEQFVEWIEAMRDSIPVDLRSSATIEFEGDEYAAECTITYERPATQAEIEATVRSVASYHAALEQEDRLTYERLKAKFGGS
jgi:hypothetical protein